MIFVILIFFRLWSSELSSSLGKWALLDIETTGIDAGYDDIIDLGYLQFEGTKLVKKYSSLVRTEVKLSQFIQKLTGINQSMVSKAPRWQEVENDLLELEGHQLVAHNSEFERKFLEKYFDKFDADEREEFNDSLLYLGLLHPGRSSLNLEGFLVDYKLADSEMHRGYEDSLDLLKVILLSTYVVSHQTIFFKSLQEAVRQNFDSNDFWLSNFLFIEEDELYEIAQQIDFDLQAAAEKYFNAVNEEEIENSNSLEWDDLSFSGDTIQKVLSNEEKLQQISPSYHFRPAQLNLSKRVGQAFKNGIHALIQAPTGTGKTLGYLIPSALFTKETGTQVLVATGTKTLQNQAFSKDVPQLRKILGLSEDQLKVTQLVGSSNHYCELLFRNKLQEEEGLLGSLGPFGEKYAKTYLEVLFQLNALSPYEKKLTRLDTPYILKLLIKEFSEYDKEVSVDFRSCTGSKCPFSNSCSYIQGLRQANESQIIIGNHALMMTWPKGVPKPEYVVVDEAHRIEKEATSMFTFAVTQQMLDIFGRSLESFQGIGALLYLMSFEDHSQEKTAAIRTEVQDKREMIKEHQDELPLLFESLFKKMPKYTSIYWNERIFPSKAELKDSLLASIYNHLDSLKFLYESLYTYLFPYTTRFNAKDTDNEQKIMAITRFETFMASLEDIVNGLTVLMGGSEDYTHSMKYKEGDGFAVQSAPVDVGKDIFKNVLDESAATVFTSATLANADGTMGATGVEWMTGYLYLDNERRFKSGLYLPPTFDYKNNTNVHLCTDVPAMYQEDFIPKVLGKVMPLVLDLGGRSLLLFSSKVRFEIAREILLKEYDGKIPVFIQGMGTNVVEDFKQANNGILLGMETFGEGIDIPGEKLQFLFVDKVPDLRMDLVIQDRRKFFDSRFGNEFNDYYLAHRTRSLHQKLGRLLRKTSDVGAAIVVDSRLSRWKGGTLRAFKNMMQPYDVHFSNIDKACEDVLHYLQDKNS